MPRSFAGNIILNWCHYLQQIRIAQGPKVTRYLAGQKPRGGVSAGPLSRRSPCLRGHLPTNGCTRIRDSVNSLTSSCPVWSVSNLSNSASINLSHSSLETLPLLSVSIASNSCLAAWAASSAASSVVAAAWRWSHYCRFLALGLCGIHCHNSG